MYGYNLLKGSRMREVIFLGDTRKRIREFPDEMRNKIGYALQLAQGGETHENAKPFKGYPGVMEIALRHESGAYRVVYALKIGASIYVLHAFQKKSKHGIETPLPDLELISARFKIAKQMEEYNV
jgi:phage-related protein